MQVFLESHRLFSAILWGKMMSAKQTRRYACGLTSEYIQTEEMNKE